MTARALILFDIDGTLITSGGAGEQALRLALHDLTGVEDDLASIEISGRTDRSIARRMVESFAAPATPEKVDGLLDSYVRHLRALLPVRSGRVFPGITPIVETLHEDGEIAMGLLTGNLKRGAELKLTHYGLWQYFPFGAFADDSEDRNGLGPFALDRAARHHGEPIAAEATYVIGDTPHDIACGRAFGAKTVAVATGSHSSVELAACSPDFLYDDFSSHEDVLGTLLGAVSGSR